MLLRKTYIILLLCFATVFVSAQRSQVILQYIEKYKEIAIKEMQRTGVPAAITLAQGILESKSGQSDLVMRSQNHFGIKCKNDWMGGKVYHDDDEKGECFRSYASAEESYKDHSDFLKSRKHYAFLFKLDPTDYEGWAKGLKKAGYATNPAYPQRLMKLIQEYDLQQYTLIALQNNQQREDELFAMNGQPQAKIVAVVAADTVSDINNNQQLVFPTASKSPKLTYPAGIFYINGVKALYAKEGTSLLWIANQYHLSLQKLIGINELHGSTDILAKDQVIYLSRKARKGSNDFYISTGKETIEEIAHKEAVLTDAVIQYNKLKKGDIPAAGEKIYLKPNSASKPKLAAL